MNCKGIVSRREEKQLRGQKEAEMEVDSTSLNKILIEELLRISIIWVFLLTICHKGKALIQTQVECKVTQVKALQWEDQEIEDPLKETCHQVECQATKVQDQLQTTTCLVIPYQVNRSHQGKDDVDMISLNIKYSS